MKLCLFVALIVVGLVSAAVEQACPITCADEAACPRPFPDATCQNGVWTVGKDISGSGSISLFCPTRVNGNLNLGENSVLVVGVCGRIESKELIARNGLALEFDFGGAQAAAGQKFVFATFTSADAWISSWKAKGLGVAQGKSPLLLSPQKTNTDWAILFYEAGTPKPVEDIATNNKPAPTPGNRVRDCSSYTCDNVNICNKPNAGATCVNGVWTISGDLAAGATGASVTCPLRITGNLNLPANSEIKLGACGSVQVDGTLSIAESVALRLDLDLFGSAKSGMKFTWAKYNAIKGKITAWSVSNLWTDQQIKFVNQKSDKEYSLIVYGATLPDPSDDISTVKEAVGVFLPTSPVAPLSVPIRNPNNQVGAQDEFTDEVEQIESDDEIGVGAGDGEDVVDIEVVDIDVDDEVGVGAGDDGVEVEGEFEDEIINEVGAGEEVAGQTSEELPAYGVVLIVLGSLILLGLIVIQVQTIILFRRRKPAVVADDEVPLII